MKRISRPLWTLLRRLARDGYGLLIECTPNGSSLWRFDFRFGRKRQTMSLGRYVPEKPGEQRDEEAQHVGIAEARATRDSFRKMVQNKINPSTQRKAENAARVLAQGNTFKVIAEEWLAKQAPKWAESNSSKILALFKRDIYPHIGSEPIGGIKPPVVLACLQRIEKRAVETSHRALQHCSKVFRYAVATGRAESDPTRDLRGALTPAVGKHYPAIVHPAEIGVLLRAIHTYPGVVGIALRFLAYCFPRPRELRLAEWSEFELRDNVWRIPAEKMKAREPHIVPLAKQVITLLEELRPISGPRLLFPSSRHGGRPLSDGTLAAALSSLGFDGKNRPKQLAHSFRSTFSTTANELGWNVDLIEVSLAHAPRNETRAAYNRAVYLEGRRKLMQKWADHLDKLEATLPDARPSKRRRK
jgi:integrase